MKKHKGKILVLFLAVLLVSFMSCENSFLKKMLVEEEKGKTVPEKPQAPFIEGGALLILSPDKLDIKVKVTTADNSSVRIEGCTETELTSGTQTVLHAKGTRVILKGNIIKLYCEKNQLTALNVQGLTALQGLDCKKNQLTALNVQGLTTLYVLLCDNNQLTALNVQGLTALQTLKCSGNQLTALNVQGLTALQTLWCYNNQLTADAFKKLFDDLPVRQDSDNAKCILYTEESGVSESNHTDFSAPSDLADAFNNAKNNKKWKMYKINGRGHWVEI